MSPQFNLLIILIFIKSNFVKYKLWYLLTKIVGPNTLNDQFPLNLSSEKVSSLIKIMNFILRNSFPTTLHAITQCIKISFWHTSKQPKFHVTILSRLRVNAYSSWEKFFFFFQMTVVEIISQPSSMYSKCFNISIRSIHFHN